MFVVDRIENGIAIVEYGDLSLEVPVNSFKQPVSEGDVLYFVIDKEETEARKKDIKKRLFDLFNRK